MKIYAHRGYSGLYPENTMTAFIRAAETPAAGIELDIQMTKDGTVVVIHDEEVDRTTDGTGKVCDYTFRELKGFNANKTHPETAVKEHIPSFEEYCEWAASVDLATNVEIKTGNIYYPGIEEQALKIIAKYGLGEKIFFSSFNPLSIALIKEMHKTMKCGLLVEHPIVNVGALCRASGFECYHPCIDFVTDNAVKECHSSNILVNVWTTNTREDLDKLRALNVDGAFSNFPEIS